MLVAQYWCSFVADSLPVDSLKAAMGGEVHDDLHTAHAARLMRRPQMSAPRTKLTAHQEGTPIAYLVTNNSIPRELVGNCHLRDEKDQSSSLETLTLPVLGRLKIKSDAMILLLQCACPADQLGLLPAWQDSSSFCKG